MQICRCDDLGNLYRGGQKSLQGTSNSPTGDGACPYRGHRISLQGTVLPSKTPSEGGIVSPAQIG